MTAALAALGTLLAFAALWELAGAAGAEIGRGARSAAAALSGGRIRSLASAALWLRVPERLRRAGLAHRLPPHAVLAAKAGGAAVGLLAGIAVASGLPARLALVAVPGAAVAGFLAPDALLERAAAARRRRLVSALPDALDLLAVGVASGRSPSVVFAEIATGAGGPLAAELAVTVSEIESGASIADAVAGLRERVPGAEVGTLATALERSRRYGSPLADQLRDQATALRRDARRRIEERSARAAPKIQLVVALVLVPSVLLMIAATIIAHSDALFGAF
jgi:tight adherence protein C